MANNFKAFLYLLWFSLGVMASETKIQSPFSSTCTTSTAFRDLSTNLETSCDDKMICSCSHYLLSNKSWNCIGNEKPCGDPKEIPRYPTSSFQASLIGSVDDGSAIINITQQWIYDGTNRRERMDSVVWERSPEPNRFFSSRSIHMVTTGEMVFEVTSESVDMRDAQCKGFPAPQVFTGTAAIGAINRFLPRDDRLFASHDDKYLGPEMILTSNGIISCNVWGWIEHDSYTLKEAGFHKVFVSAETGWPVREVEVLHIEDSDPVIVTMDFQFETRVTYVSGGWYLGTDVEASIFDVPRDCSVPRPKRHQQNPGDL